MEKWPLEVGTQPPAIQWYGRRGCPEQVVLFIRAHFHDSVRMWILADDTCPCLKFGLDTVSNCGLDIVSVQVCVLSCDNHLCFNSSVTYCFAAYRLLFIVVEAIRQCDRGLLVGHAPSALQG